MIMVENKINIGDQLNLTNWKKGRVGCFLSKYGTRLYKLSNA